MTEHTPSTPSGSPDGASHLLDEVTEVRSRTRTHLQSFWFPVTLFGVITLLSAPFTLIGDGAGVAWFWCIAGPLGRRPDRLLLPEP